MLPIAAFGCVVTILFNCSDDFDACDSEIHSEANEIEPPPGGSGQLTCSEVSESSAWVLAISGDPIQVRADFHPLAAEWADAVDRERSLGIPPGFPVLISGHRVDDRINVYFRHGFSRDQTSTAYTYAVELRRWFIFLNNRDVFWDEARREDVRAFQTSRVYDERNPKRVSPATWNKGWAALRHFYGWAKREGWIDQDPVGIQDRLRNPLSAGGHREKNARASRDRWLTPREYSMWRDIGLRGYLAAIDSNGRIVAGLPNEAFRGRNTARNAAFTDYVLSTGLREQEAGSLLTVEVPAAIGDKVPLIGKGKVFRHYAPLYRGGLESVQAYRAGERREAIRRAQASGRYEEVSDRLIVLEVRPGGRQGPRMRLQDGRTVDVVTLTPKERQRLLSRGEGGLEPAALWLTDAGEAMPHTTWNAVFNTANIRVSHALNASALGSPWVKVTPHSLRFTFALMVLVAGVRATDERRSIGPADPFLEGNYSHVFEEVRDLLGHASVETTKRIYLEPVKGLRRSSLFRASTLDEMWEGLAAASPLIGFGGVK